jgi:BirA family biotin operon repressor/biotin-[acetyl-CoA-carboxylase] ligase
MSGDHLSWGAQALWQQLTPLLPGVSVEVLARCESTNSELLERARQHSGRRGDDQQPCLLVAEQQTRGRGRNGKAWMSHPGASLTFSMSLPMQPAEWSGLSLAVGVSLAQALDPLADSDDLAGPPRLKLKWPNDLWLGAGPGAGRKLGGILIETLAARGARFVVVGVGLNVQQLSPGGLDHGFACLQELWPAITAPQVLAMLALPLVQGLKRFEQHGFKPFAAAFAQRDLLRGMTVTTTSSEVPEGIAEGVDDSGALRVRAQALHTIVGGEVSVRPAAQRQEPASC